MASQQERDRKFIDALYALEAQKEAQHHLQVQVDKPCASMFISCKVFPEVGERSLTFYALAAELRRMGTVQSKAEEVLKACYEQLPTSIKSGIGGGHNFTPKEVMTCVRSAYRSEKIKSHGCNSHIWDTVCVGANNCHFHKLISTGHRQSQAAQQNTFLTWLAAKDGAGKLLLKGNSVRTYLGLERIEKQRGYRAGSILYVSWRELSEVSGIGYRRVGDALTELAACGLIQYTKGVAAQRGTASEVKRILPVPNWK